MKSFEVEGISYRSISEFCRKRKVSYWKMVRLCRYYSRAKHHPEVAAKWILGIDDLNKDKEPKTSFFIKSKEYASVRQMAFRLKKRLNLRKTSIKMFTKVN